MRNVILYIAMSLDGRIADAHGGVGWIGGQDSSAETVDTYPEFVKEIDTVILGWKTYEQIVTGLSPGEWVYAGLDSYVVTHRGLPAADGIRFTGKSPCALVRRLKCGLGKKIWICGGADLVQQLLKEDLIDEFRISVIPVILGSGVRLFGESPEIRLELTGTRSDNGITELRYQRGSAAF